MRKPAGPKVQLELEMNEARVKHRTLNTDESSFMGELGEIADIDHKRR